MELECRRTIRMIQTMPCTGEESILVVQRSSVLERGDYEEDRSAVLIATGSAWQPYKMTSGGVKQHLDQCHRQVL